MKRGASVGGWHPWGWAPVLLIFFQIMYKRDFGQNIEPRQTSEVFDMASSGIQRIW